MIEEAGVRFNNGDYYHLKVDTEQTTCEVDGTIDGVQVTFFGDVEAGRLIGCTVGWNQLVAIKDTSQTKTANGVTFTDNRDGTYTVSTDANGATANTPASLGSVTLENGHKYLLSSVPSGGSSNTYYAYIIGGGTISGYDTGNGVIYASTGGSGYLVFAYFKAGTTMTTPKKFIPQLFDLTQMFGSTIADYIYSLEQDTPGAGVDLFRTLFTPDDYYPYDAGTQMKIALIPEA